jgi:hypothetical protein
MDLSLEIEASDVAIFSAIGSLFIPLAADFYRFSHFEKACSPRSSPMDFLNALNI